MRRTIPWARVAPLAVLAAGILWALWPVLAAMADRWTDDPRYAHGYLVPVFSVALLRLRWTLEVAARSRPSTWGLLFIALGAAVQLLGGYFRLNSVEGFAFLPYLAGTTLMLGGWPIMKWAWPAIAFLIFMIPLPWRLEKALGPPLQYLATLASTFTLQTLGLMAFSEGNVIQLNENKIGVVEACSGLSMLITFIALSTGMAMVVKRPLLDKIVLVMSAIPVALVANISRITLTGVLYETVGGDVADHFYHDIAGWVMIPFALVLYWGVIWIFSHILLEVEQGRVVIGVPANPQAAATRSRAATMQAAAAGLGAARRG
jgi:exosortase